MRSRLVLSTVVALALACLAEPLLSQEGAQRGQRGQGGEGGQRGGRGFGGGGFGGGGGGFGFFGGGGFNTTSRLRLLSVEAVQKELELVDEQLTAIQKVRDELQPMRGFGGRGGPGGEGGQPGGRRRGGNNPPGNNPPSASLWAPSDWFYVQQQGQGGQSRGRGGPGGGFGQLTEEQRAEFEKQRLDRLKQEKEKLAEILLPHQMKRLNEIYYQQLGTGIFEDPDAVAALKITAEQKAKAAEVRTANGEAMQALMREILQGGNRGEGGRGGFQLTDEQRKKQDDARKANDAKLFAILTADQTKMLDELKGKPFEMPEGALRGRGGFGGGGPGGAPGGRRGGNNPNP